MARTIRWGMIGAGDVTEVKSGPGFQKAQNSALVAVMRRNGALAKDYAERHSVSRWYDDAAALIHDPDVDAVYIATPPKFHKDYTLMCAAANKPVYCEKPMAMNDGECQAMIAACAQANVPLWVAFYRRALPRFLKIKELLESGAIGEIRAVTTTLFRPLNRTDFDPNHLPWRVTPEISGGGLFVDVGSHTLDLLDYLISPIKSVKGFATNRARLYPAEDHIAAAFEFESGILGIGTWCFNSAYNLDQTQIMGTYGHITFSTFDDNPVRIVTNGGEESFTIPHPPHIQQPLIQMIVDELNGDNLCVSTGQAAARTQAVIDDLLSAYYSSAVGVS